MDRNLWRIPGDYLEIGIDEEGSIVVSRTNGPTISWMVWTSWYHNDMNFIVNMVLIHEHWHHGEIEVRSNKERENEWSVTARSVAATVY